MTHSEFVEKYNSNKLLVNVDKNKAGYMYRDPYLMPHKLRYNKQICELLPLVDLLLA